MPRTGTGAVAPAAFLRPAVFALALMSGLAAPALAVQPDEFLPDPTQEARARIIGKDLRCLVCQNQSIDDSDAELARDLRVLVRERIKAGDNDTQVRQYIVDRYGNYVLLKPPVNGETLLLWGGPALLLLGGVLAARSYYRRAAEDAAAAGKTEPAPLSEEERRKLAALTQEQSPS